MARGTVQYFPAVHCSPYLLGVDVVGVDVDVGINVVGVTVVDVGGNVVADTLGPDGVSFNLADDLGPDRVAVGVADHLGPDGISFNPRRRPRTLLLHATTYRSNINV